MLRFVRKHKGTIIAVAVVILALTAAFFWGNSSRPREAETSLPSREAKDSGGQDSTGISAVLSEKMENSPLQESSAESIQTQETHEPESVSEPESSAVSESSIDNRGDSSAEESLLPAVSEQSDDASFFVSSAVSQPDEGDSSAPQESQASLAPEESQQDKTVSEQSVCRVSISCETLLNRIDELKPAKRSLVPEDGVLLSVTSVSIEEGESVFEVTKRLCREQGISFEFTLTPIYHTAYVEGIGNLYEFDCGSGSGWLFSVNGEYPAFGCSNVTVRDGDIIRWEYTCELGHDISGKQEEG